VLLALRSGEHHTLRRTRPRDAERLALEHQHADRDGGREVLVGNADAALGPEVADEHERRPDHVVVDQGLVEAALDRLADDALGERRVARQDGVGVRPLELGRALHVALMLVRT
jgi:hypothetical protein